MAKSKLLALVDEGVSQQDFVGAFSNVVARVKRFETALTKDFSALSDTITQMVKNAAAQINDRLDAVDKRVDSKLASIKVKDGAQGPKGEPGAMGPKGEDGTMGPKGADGSPDKPQDIRDKLETLTGEARLDKSAIRGIEKLEEDIKAKSVQIVGGRSLLQLYVDGQKKGAIQYLNLVPGSGVTLSYSQAHGRNDITISASGGGGGGSLGVISVSGTINDSNTSFTAASTPTVVVVNGASYRNGHGCTISGTSITLDNPVGTNGDIYALA